MTDHLISKKQAFWLTNISISADALLLFILHFINPLSDMAAVLLLLIMAILLLGFGSALDWTTKMDKERKEREGHN